MSLSLYIYIYIYLSLQGTYDTYYISPENQHGTGSRRFRSKAEVDRYLNRKNKRYFQPKGLVEKSSPKLHPIRNPGKSNRPTTTAARIALVKERKIQKSKDTKKGETAALKKRSNKMTKKEFFATRQPIDAFPLLCVCGIKLTSIQSKSAHMHYCRSVY